MADSLLAIGYAAELWWAATIRTIVLDQPWQNRSDVCNGQITNWTERIYLQAMNQNFGAAALIGIDPDSCLSFWHLTGLVLDAKRTNKGLLCQQSVCQVGTDPPYFFANVILNSMEDQQLAITDTGSTARPIDGQAVVQHGGYPVAAAVRVGTDQWQAIAGGNASALTVAAAKAACGLSGANACTQTAGCNTHVIINVN